MAFTLRVNEGVAIGNILFVVLKLDKSIFFEYIQIDGLIIEHNSDNSLKLSDNEILVSVLILCFFDDGLIYFLFLVIQVNKCNILFLQSEAFIKIL